MGMGFCLFRLRLARAGADYFGVAAVEEGVSLRKAGINQPILCVGAAFKSSLEEAVENDIILTLYEEGQLGQMRKAALKAGCMQHCP